MAIQTTTKTEGVSMLPLSMREDDEINHPGSSINTNSATEMIERINRISV